MTINDFHKIGRTEEQNEKLKRMLVRKVDQPIANIVLAGQIDTLIGKDDDVDILDLINIPDAADMESTE